MFVVALRPGKKTIEPSKNHRKWKILPVIGEKTSSSTIDSQKTQQNLNINVQHRWILVYPSRLRGTGRNKLVVFYINNTNCSNVHKAFVVVCNCQTGKAIKDVCFGVFEAADSICPG